MSMLAGLADGAALTVEGRADDLAVFDLQFNCDLVAAKRVRVVVVNICVFEMPLCCGWR